MQTYFKVKIKRKIFSKKYDSLGEREHQGRENFCIMEHRHNSATDPSSSNKGVIFVVFSI